MCLRHLSEIFDSKYPVLHDIWMPYFIVVLKRRCYKPYIVLDMY